MRDQQEGKPHRQPYPSAAVSLEHRIRSHEYQRHKGKRCHLAHGRARIRIYCKIARKRVNDRSGKRRLFVGKHRPCRKKRDKRGQKGDEHDVELICEYDRNAGVYNSGGNIQHPVAVKKRAAVPYAVINGMIYPRRYVSRRKLVRKRIYAVKMKINVMPLGLRHKRKRDHTQHKHKHEHEICVSVCVQMLFYNLRRRKIF